MSFGWAKVKAARKREAEERRRRLEAAFNREEEDALDYRNEYGNSDPVPRKAVRRIIKRDKLEKRAAQSTSGGSSAWEG